MVSFLSSGVRMVIILAILALTQQFELCAGELEDRVTLAERTKVLSSKYGFKIVAIDIPEKKGEITVEPATSQRYLEYLSMFEQELDFYPTEYFEAISLDKLILCGQIAGADFSYEGYNIRLKQTIYLDVVKRELVNDSTDALTRKKLTIHHELFHVFDDVVHFDRVKRFYNDPYWWKLNEPSFLYHVFGGELPSNRGLSDAMPGFLTGYSRQTENEDKAEIFGWLMVDPAQVEIRQARDDRLRQKVTRLKMVVVQKCPNMNESFWAKVRRQNGGATK